MWGSNIDISACKIVCAVVELLFRPDGEDKIV